VAESEEIRRGDELNRPTPNPAYIRGIRTWCNSTTTIWRQRLRAAWPTPRARTTTSPASPRRPYPSGFGLAILSTGLVAVPSSTGFTFVGIARQKHKSTPNSTAVAQYDIGEAISIVRKGRIWVESEQAVNPTLSVFLRHTVNSALVPGNFRVDADTAKADQITNAKWVSVTTGAGLAILEVNQP
jgi:hypothetical protein